MRRAPALLLLCLSTACQGVVQDAEAPDEVTVSSLNEQERRGRDIWFNNTYGGEKFFRFLENHPDPQRRIKIGFEKVLRTPRELRFAVWGVINDPDCTSGGAGNFDVCPDPTASGVVGIRKFPDGQGGYLYGAACASCHAGFDPLNPPADPAEPEWDNIHATIGNQFLKTGKLFAANLAPDDIRALMFLAWPDGTVDTTALFNDHIMNPGVMTAFWEHHHRNEFEVEGYDEPKLRNGQGGEDDVGGDIAALRVYTNIGVCFFECVAPAVAQNRPISIDECRQTCPDFPPQQDLDDLTNFLATHSAPRYPGPKPGNDVMERGRQVFEANCASCHDNSGRLSRVLSNDEVNSLASLGSNAMNACRALGTNWDPGHIWAEFASSTHHQRSIDGTKGYRSMPLAGIWSTAPFFHNQSIGGPAPSPSDPPEARGAAYEAAMRELLSTSRVPRVNVTPFDITTPDGTVIPAGTPLTFIFSRNPETGEILCADYVENRGHYYGANLSDADKDALIQWLKFQ